MKTYLLFFFLSTIMLLFPNEILAQELVPSSPSSALLQRSGGVMEVREDVNVKVVDGQSVCQIVLPEGAQNINITVKDHTILSWTQTPITFKRTSAAVAQRNVLEERLQEIAVELAVIDQRLAIWERTSEAFTYQDLENIEKKQIAILPELLKKKNALVKEKTRLEAEIKNQHKAESTGYLVTIVLAGDVSAPKVHAKYNYFLQSCGWKPHYTFAIEPEQDKNELKMLFLADVWQNSGLDWQNTNITLMTGSQGGRVPPKIENWLITKHEEMRSRNAMARYEDVADTAQPMLSTGALVGARGKSAIVNTDTSGIYAKWQLTSKKLPEGKIEMLIKESVINTPLLWVARPSRSAGDVFLMAKFDIKQGEVWPAGNAIYMVQGQEIGRGNFESDGGTVVLYFGRDPRVSLEVIQDKNQRGESGFLGREKTWSWGWIYKIKNTHQRALTVRIERPEPRAVDEDIKIMLADNPKASVDKAKHLLFWDVNVGAGSEATVNHAVTIKAPEKMPVYPVAP